MWTLGINAAFHDSAAAIVENGVVRAAAEEERFTRIKHGKRSLPQTAWELPFHSIAYCLRECGIRLTDIDAIGYAFDPSLITAHGGQGASGQNELVVDAGPYSVYGRGDGLMLGAIAAAPALLRETVPHHLRRWLGDGTASRARWHFVDHHVAHAASAFLPSPFSEAAVLTLDGRGERATTTYSLGAGLRLERIGQVDMPHSLGLLYEEFTEFLGFLRSSDEFKVMALASFGEPRFLEDLRALVPPVDQGIFTVRNTELSALFGAPRLPGGPYEKRDFDLAASLQHLVQERVLELVYWLHGQAERSAISGARENLCLAGGVALNCVLNAHVRDEGPFREIWVQPAAGDAGTALGAALWIDAQSDPARGRVWSMADAYLGPGYSDEEIESFLRWTGMPYRRLENVAAETAALLADDKILGWLQGRMEFGPRALGARSILASPLHAEMQDRLNEVKDREDFRPVAPVVLEEEAGEWFEGARRSPFMLFVFPVRQERLHEIPAVTHTDGSARIQTVTPADNPRYYELLCAFKERTGVPVLVNTSFNSRGHPIVCSPQDALECFASTPIDGLVLGSFLLLKEAYAR